MLKDQTIHLKDKDSDFYLDLKHSKGVLKKQKQSTTCQHNYTIFVFITGHQLLSFSKGDFVIRGGDIFLINKGTYYRGLIHKGETEYISISFHFEEIFPVFHEDFKLMEELFTSSVPFVKLNELSFANISNEIAMLFNAEERDMNIYKLNTMNVFLDLLLKFYESYHFQNYYINDLDSETASVISLILKTTAFIQDHFKNKLSLKTLAENVNLSTSYLSRNFKEEIGVSVVEYINHTRLNFAEQMLETTHLSISEICYESGFNSISQFNKCFKKRFAITPSEFRKNTIK